MQNSPLTFWEKNLYRNLWQHPLWGEFQRAVGRKVFLLKEGEAFGLVIRHSLPLGFCWLELPRGPLFEDTESLSLLTDKIRTLAKKEKALFVRFSSYEVLDIKGLHPARGDHHPETSLILDLGFENEELLDQMKPKGRYNIKVAQKHGVKVKASQDVSAFYALLEKTGGRDGFGIHPKRYYEKMLETLGEHAQLLLAEHEGKVVAGGIFVYLDEWAVYYYGASGNDHRHLMAPYLIQWEAIREAKKRYCKYYDFLGIAPDDGKKHPWAGVTSFKKKFGGEVVHYPQARDLMRRPFLYRVYWAYKRLRG